MSKNNDKDDVVFLPKWLHKFYKSIGVNEVDLAHTWKGAVSVCAIFVFLLLTVPQNRYLQEVANNIDMDFYASLSELAAVLFVAVPITMLL